MRLLLTATVGLLAAFHPANAQSPGGKKRVNVPAKSKSALNPQSAAYLERVIPKEIPSTKVLAGTKLMLIKLVPIAETPDYDPVEDLGSISVKWRQIAGAEVTWFNADTARAEVLLPEVRTPTTLIFAISGVNKSGKREAQVAVSVRPAK